MFESALETNLKAIFGVKKVSFAEPGPAAEQECLFVEANDPFIKIADGRARARVSGTITLYGNSDKLPFGFFAKAIDRAPKALILPFFFYDLEQNTRRYQNLVQRSCSFVYFFDSEYDPETGTITSVDFIEE